MSQPSIDVAGKSSAFLLQPLACIIILALYGTQGALAQDEFDMAALETSGPKLNVDLSQFSQPGSQLPGRYHVDVYVNHEQVDTQTLDFVQDKHGQLTPVVTPALLAQWGIKIGDIDALRNKNSINDLAATVPDSQIRLDYSQMRLDLTIPQAERQQRGAGFRQPDAVG